jgi:hypothetical protein
MISRRPSISWPALLCFPLGVLGAVCARYAVLLPFMVEDFLLRFPVLRQIHASENIEGLVRVLSVACGVGGAGFVCVALMGLLIRKRWVLGFFRKACIASTVLIGLYGHIVVKFTDAIQTQNLMVEGVAPESYAVFLWRWTALWPVLLVGVLMALCYLTVWRTKVIAAFTGEVPGEPEVGDRIIENVRTNGQDPVFRKSIWSSVGMHLFVILVLPWLLTFAGCVDPYLVPQGSGTPEVNVARVTKVVKKKKKKRLLVNPQSAISFYKPDLDDSQVAKDVEEQSRVTYVADANRVNASAGKMGAGGGTKGGWPDGMANGKVRFIRLEYNGPGWDDGMDAVSRADMNFLDAFKKLTGFNVAAQSESHPIGLLSKYPKGMAPPFVYITGSGDIGVSDRDVTVLREYLMGGGMLFADCGSPRWDAHFRSLAQRVFPGEPLTTISDDDPIFQFPFAFANGAPPLWHHGGMRSQGAKYKGRWAIFYHPGDINDAWKTGRSGMDAKLAEGATEMGVNIVYYSFTHYLELTRKYRK